MKTDANGIPILTIPEKLAALEACLRNGSWEDSCGHLCDLLAHVGLGGNGPFDSLGELVAHYGANPAPILPAAPTAPQPVAAPNPNDALSSWGSAYGDD